METRANYVLIGAFVLLAAAALALFAVLMSGAGLSRQFTPYDVVFEGPVNGLTEGGEVRFNGIKVGEVKRLSLDRKDPNRVIARVSVDAQTPVRTDSVAELNFLGVTGVTFIQIRAGSPQMPLMPKPENGQPAVIKAERTALDELFQGGQDMFSEAGKTIQAINDVLNETNVEEINAILKNVRVATDKISREGGLIDTAQSALEKIDGTVESVDTAVASIDTAAKDFDALVGDLRVFVKDASPVVSDLRSTMSNVNKAVASVSDQLLPNADRTLESFANTAGDLRSVMIRLQGLIGEVEQDPSRFVYRQPQPTE